MKETTRGSKEKNRKERKRKNNQIFIHIGLIS